MTTQVTLTILELCITVHALEVRVAEFERLLSNERALSAPCYNEKLIAYYEREIAEARSVLSKLEFAKLHLDY